MKWRQLVCANKKEKGKICMSHQTPVKRVFFHGLKGNKYAFADERTRKHLLNIMEEIQSNSNWKIYAFCMTDQEAYFVIEAKSLIALSRDLAIAAEHFEELCRKMLPKWWSESIHLQVGEGKRLRTEEEIKQYCCLLHQIPLKYGYVERLCDYWWSSYITYTGIYEWRMVSCEWLLQQFSEHPSKARQKLKDYHQKTITSGSMDMLWLIP